MQITNKKKSILIILSLVVVGSGILLLLLTYLKKDKENSFGPMQTSTTSSQNIIKTSSDNSNTIINASDFITEKSIILIIAMSGLDRNFLSDSLFTDFDSNRMQTLRQEITSLGQDIDIRILNTYVNSDILSGQVQTEIKNKTGSEINITFVFSKNPEGEWKLVDYFKKSLILIEDKT